MKTRIASGTRPLPAPDVPVITKTGFGLLPVEEANELRPLTLRQAADRLGLANAGLVEEARGFHAAELRDGHEDVEHLRRLDVLGRTAKNLVDADAAVLEVLLQLRPLDPDVFRSLER